MTKRKAYNPDLPTVQCPQCRGTGASPGAFQRFLSSRDTRPATEQPQLRCSYCGGKGHVNAAEVNR